MKIFVSVIDSVTGVTQFGMIDEPVKKGFEVMNAINHFVTTNENGIQWDFNGATFKCGKLKDTSKLINVTILE